MIPLADSIPTMSNDGLASLRINAVHLAKHGSAGQMTAAGDALSLVDAELARRASLPPPIKPPPRPAPRKPRKATGHQTALPKTP